MKPIIGITSNHMEDDKIFIKAGVGGLGQDWSVIANDCADSIIRAGGIPFFIPVSDDEEYLKSVCETIDGLFISGGNDIDPLLFNMRADKYTGLISPKRDFQEMFLIDYIYKYTNKPILAICRGMQILNVYFKGNLIMDIPSAGYPTHSINKMDRTKPVHSVEIDKDSILYNIIGGDKLFVNSLHHQGVDIIGEKLKPVAKCEDGIIEALEYENNNDRFIMAIQWHPEMMSSKDKGNQSIFDYFVDKSK